MGGSTTTRLTHTVAQTHEKRNIKSNHTGTQANQKVYFVTYFKTSKKSQLMILLKCCKCANMRFQRTLRRRATEAWR